MFADQFARFADNDCLRDPSRAISYSQVLALGRQIIAGLPKRRCLVVLRCSVTIESVAAYAALVVDGHVPLLLEASLSDVLADQIIAAYSPDAIVDPATATVAPGPGGTEVHPATGLLLTTSGSTGSPKLVRLSAEGVGHNAAAIAEYLALTPSERAFVHLPMSYSYGISIIHSHWIAGASLCLTSASVMEPGYWDQVREHAATSIAGVPFHYTTIRRLGEAKLEISSLKTLTQAGGRLDPKLVGWFVDWAQRTGRKFVVMYGQTEAGPRIAYLPAEAALTAPDAIGIPIPGVRIDLHDSNGDPVPNGTPGEMQVTSPGVMLGYARTAADLALGDTLGGTLPTGDIAVRGEDGLLRIVGRSAHILKIYGLRVNIDEVETRLASLGYTTACFGIDDSLRVLADGAVDTAALRVKITELFSLPPRGITVRAATTPVERSATGKLSAAALDAAWEAATP